LHLGNIEFAECKESSVEEMAVIKDSKALGFAASLFKVPEKDLASALLTQVVPARGEFVAKKHDASGELVVVTISAKFSHKSTKIYIYFFLILAASYTRDALAKATYERVFQLIVSRINNTLRSEKFDSDKTAGVIGGNLL
jgi:myosin heavy subunit